MKEVKIRESDSEKVSEIDRLCGQLQEGNDTLLLSARKVRDRLKKVLRAAIPKEESEEKLAAPAECDLVEYLKANKRIINETQAVLKDILQSLQL